VLRIVTVIPARGGSKSLPNKNILPLNGKPLLCYSIDYSKSSCMISKTIVTTDYKEIATIAKKCGAEVPFLRPSKYSQDDTRDYPFMRHALDYFDSIGEFYDIYILLRPTSPMRPKGLIERSIKIFEDNPSATSVRSVAKIKEHPYRAWTIAKDGKIQGFVGDIQEPYNIPRQKLPAIYFQTGDIEAIKRETILSGSISGDDVFPLIIKHNEMIDIDEFGDFRKAESRLI